MLMHGTHLLGIDLGASDLKLNVIEIDSLEHVAGVRHAIPTEHPQTNWAEQNPQTWELALIHALTKLSASFDLRQLAGLSITAGAHIPVLLDKTAQVLRPAILWSDQRSAANALKLAQNPAFLEKSLNQPNATWTASMLHWLSDNEPETMQKCAHILPAKDYLRYLLSGEMLTDPSDAVGFLLSKNYGTAWSDTLCEMVGISSSQLPRIAPSLSQQAKVSQQAAYRFGLPEGLPIVTGAIDTTVELLCCDTSSEPHTIIKMASAGVVYQTSNAAVPQPPISLYPQITPAYYYYAAGMNSCATSLRWMTKTLLGEQTATREIFELAAHSTAGANGVLTLPYFMGERAPIWNANVRAATLGMTQLNTPADLAMSVIEGSCFALKDVYQSMQSLIDDDSEQPIALIGGGAKSALWRETLASVLERPLTVARYSDAAYGTALTAGLALEAISLVQIRQRNRRLEPIQPNLKHQTRYRAHWQRYQQAQQFLIDFYR